MESNDFLVRQCNNLIQEKVSVHVVQFKNYLNSISSVDMAFMSASCHHYGVIFSRFLAYSLQLEIIKLNKDEDMLKTLIECIKKE